MTARRNQQLGIALQGLSALALSLLRIVKLKVKDDKSKKFPSIIENFAVLTEVADKIGVLHVVWVCARDKI